MSLQKCKECGHDISTKSKSCPHCGAIQRRCNLIIILILSLCCLIIIWISASYLPYHIKFLPKETQEKQQKIDSEKTVKKDEPKIILESPIEAPIFKLDLNFLENAKYNFGHEIIELTKGKYEMKDKNKYPKLVNLEYVCFGDLNGDGLEDAAVILGRNPGGGYLSFYYLFVIINGNKKPDVISIFVSLDGRIIKSINIENREIVINLVAYGPNDPKLKPTLEKIVKYNVADNNIVKVKPPSQRAQNAIAALKKLQAKTEVGINYGNYLTSLGDTKYQVDLYLKSDERLNHSILNKEIPKHISKAMEYYLLAKLIWSYKFGPRNPMESLEAQIENINKKYGSIDYNSQLGKVIHKYYPKIGSYYVDTLLPIIWSDAAKEIETASGLIE